MLSACVTARGELRDAEGVYGLRRAFRAAGAGSLILSLWRVDDEATHRLMTLLYSDLVAGKAPAAALQGAKQSLRKDPKFSHPVYWASFQYVAGTCVSDEVKKAMSTLQRSHPLDN